MSQDNIRIGAMAGKGGATAEYIRQIIPHGFESFQINFWQTLGGVNLPALARRVKDVLADSGAVVSSLGIYGNPLDRNAENYELTRKTWRKMIDSAGLFGCDLVCGFTGRITDKPIPDSLPAYKRFFGPMAKRAADRGVRIAFENCQMRGDWNRGGYNIAHGPDAWERMFDALPADNIGLEWEPCHQMVELIDPMPQLRRWVGKIFHVHGKDATIYWDVVRRHGIGGAEQFAFHRTPGFGDSNWTDIISELRRGGFVGSIDIEGWHDPVYRDELEMTGQVAALDYLKRCRGTFVPNPK